MTDEPASPTDATQVAPAVAPGARAGAEKADKILKRAASLYVESGCIETPVVRALKKQAARLIADAGFAQHVAILALSR